MYLLLEMVIFHCHVSFWGGNWICFAAHGSHLFRVQKHEFIVHVPLAALEIPSQENRD